MWSSYFFSHNFGVFVPVEGKAIERAEELPWLKNCVELLELILKNWTREDNKGFVTKWFDFANFNTSDYAKDAVEGDACVGFDISTNSAGSDYLIVNILEMKFGLDKSRLQKPKKSWAINE